ncbi:hypothetical protein FGG08_006443 [Glutinoglossum americanum]|uniref:SET domain-containing protein n=1 Tax=Glutinoglossum americanum TaxID=1670608 RepID=A0A9P8HSL7_9PEZI|nr:hypothetical protein FGG08_006443 [Glutinoglossum americanum]
MALTIKLREASRNRYHQDMLNRLLESQEQPAKTYDQELDPPLSYAAPPDKTSWRHDQWWIGGGNKRYFEESRLHGWGINRNRKYATTVQEGGKPLASWQLYTIALANSPYNPTYWIARAFHFFQLGFYDLALGDAYRAMNLAEVVTDPFQRGKRPGLYNLVHNAVEQHLLMASDTEPGVLEKLRSNFGVPYFLYPLRQAINHTISLSLIQTESWKDYEIHESYLLDRLIMNDEDTKLFTGRRARYAPVVKQAERRLPTLQGWRHEIRRGFVTGKQHPQALPIKRTGRAFIQKLTKDFARGCEGVGPAVVEVAAKAIRGRNRPDSLGLFASAEIPANTFILIDEPNVRGLSRHLETNEDVERIRRYARNCKEAGSIAERPPTIQQEHYLCENCFSTPRAFEVLRAHREALNIPVRDPPIVGPAAVRAASPAYVHSGNVCKCALADPHIYFCWKDGQVDEDEWVATHPQRSHGNIKVQKPVKRHNRPVLGAETQRQDYPDQENGMDVEYQGQKDYSYDSDTDDINDQIVEYEDAEGVIYLGRLGGDGSLWTFEGEMAWADSIPLKYSFIGDDSEDETNFRGYMNPRKRKAQSQNQKARYQLSVLLDIPPVVPEDQQPPTPDEPRGTCLQVARSVFHHNACSKNDWRWLHAATQPPWDEHGTLLCLLLKEVFDMTVKQQKVHEQCTLPVEIDPIIGLCGGENRPKEKFPFSWSGNIVVPFDILEALGVNIYNNFAFDTWAIQLTLRKLLLNAIPWDISRRGPDGDKLPDPPDLPSQYPTPTLLLFSNFALINHACGDAANATWGFDLQERHDTTHQPSQPGVPNMLLVKTTKHIHPDEEIKVNYFPDRSQSERAGKAGRLFGGKPCLCRKCVVDVNPHLADESDYGIDSHSDTDADTTDTDSSE